MILIILLAVAGFAVSLYGFIVEQKLKQDPTYKPICDISDKASCTKPMLSEYGKFLGVSNTVIGMIFYTVVCAAACLGLAKLVLLLSIGACIASAGFAYILYFKIKTFCVLCTTTYAINAGLLVVSLMKL